MRLSQLVGLVKIIVYSIDREVPSAIHLDLFKKRIITNIFGEKQIISNISSHIAPLNAWGNFAYKLLYKAKVLIKQIYARHSIYDRPSLLLPPSLAHDKIKMLLALTEQIYSIMGVQKTEEVYGFLIDFPEGWYLDDVLDVIFRIYPVTNVDVYLNNGKRLEPEMPSGYIEVFPDIAGCEAPVVLKIDLEALCNEAKSIAEELVGEEVLDMKILPREVLVYTSKANDVTELVFEEALQAHELVSIRTIPL